MNSKVAKTSSSYDTCRAPMRRRQLPSLLLLVSAACFLISSSLLAEEQPITQTRPMMNTFVQIKIYDTNELQAKAAMEAAFSEVEKLDNLLSKFKPGSEVSKINKNAANNPVKVSAATFEVIKKSIDFSKETQGAFDITVGPLMKLWGFVDKKPHLPSKEEITKALKYVGYQGVELSEKNNTVEFKVQGMEIDLGGIAKGYAVDRALEVLKVNKIKTALVDIGGNLGFVGTPTRGYWAVGIRDPKNPDKISKALKVVKGGVATSGNYENYLEINGKKFSHIIDPRTGYPVDVNYSGQISVTVGAPTATQADVFSTAAFVLGEERCRELFKNKPVTIIYHQ